MVRSHGNELKIRIFRRHEWWALNDILIVQIVPSFDRFFKSSASLPSIMSTSMIYNQVPSAASQESLPPNQYSASQYARSWGCIAVLAVFVSGIAGFAAGICAANGPDLINSQVFQISQSPVSIPPRDPVEVVQDCGDTPGEARRKGCKYDAMLQMWLPAPCFDEELSEAFLTKGKWKWFYDAKEQKELPDEVMRLGEHEVAFMTDDYHRRHCAYSWELQTRAMRERRPLLDELLSVKHAHHCNTFLLSSPQLRTNSSIPLGVEVHSGYGRCASYGKWLEEIPEE